MLSEELSEFEDYIKEFESTVYFDSEVCPTCGINLSDSITPLTAALVQIQFNSDVEKENALNKIKNSGIMVKEGEDSDKRTNDRTLLVPENQLDEIRNLLEENKKQEKN